MLKQLVKSYANVLGLDIVRYPPIPTLARQLRAFFDRAEINLVLDVGACDGGFCRFLRRSVGYSGKIVSFEPTRSTFLKLQSAMDGDSSWSGYNIGISETDGEGALNTYGDRYDFNSILNLRDADAKIYEVQIDAKQTERIQLRSIASLWSEITANISEPRVYLKTDTQGHDPAVIKGAQANLEAILGLQSEVPAIEIYEGMMSMAETINLVGRLGYSPAGFYPINQPFEYAGIPPEYDVVFLRTPRGNR